VSLDGEAAATAGGDGSFQITGVPAGEHVVGAAADGHVAADRPVTVAGGQTLSLDLFLARAGGDGDPTGDPNGAGDGRGGEAPADGGCSASGRGAPPLAAPTLMLALGALGSLARRARSRRRRPTTR